MKDDSFSVAVHSYSQMELFDKAQKELLNKEYKKLYETLKACDNYPACQTMLGYIYYNALYVDKDRSKAIKYFKQAIENGSIESMYNLGALYLKEKEYTKAKKYLEMAAKKDSQEANYNLGLIYLYGWGTKQDFKKSLHYMEQAKDLNSTQADKPIIWLKKQLKTNNN